MADNTKIEWTDATWNPITGCSVVSPGCTNCYAMRWAGTRLAHHESRAGLTRDTKAGPVWTGEVRFNEQWLDQPLRWKKPRMIFVCAHGDLFAGGVPDAWIDKVFAVMALAPQHTFQVLTKRAARMREYLSNPGCLTRVAQIMVRAFGQGEASMRLGLPLPNVWLGVSVEDQKRADERIPDLLATPAAIRWISAEPLLGPVDLDEVAIPRPDLRALVIWSALRGNGGAPTKLGWVVVGGESGPGARPMHQDWARSLRDKCTAAGVAFHFKQQGSWAACRENNGTWPVDQPGFVRLRPDGTRGEDGWPMQLVGKAHAGRLLDGIEHNGFPTPPEGGENE